MRLLLRRLAIAAAVISGSALAASADRNSIPEPTPRFEARVDPSVPVPMRDGVRLSTDLYVPVTPEQHLPAILIRTLYSKTGFGGRMQHLAEMFAAQGYVVAVQDKRGRYESEGTYVIFGGDADDGYDSVDWLSKQAWSNGKVGTYGCSYLGDVQILAAGERHPALKAMIPQASFSAIGSAGGIYKNFGVRSGGAINLGGNVGWFYDAGSKIFYRPPPGLTHEQFVAVAKLFDPAPHPKPADYAKLWWHLPIIDIMKVAGAPPTDWTDAIRHEPGDPWWEQFHYMTEEYRSDVPSLFVNSWNDFGARETILEFEWFRKHSVSTTARNNQFLLISPTTHCGSESVTAQTTVGERDVGDPRFDYWPVYLNWFAYWLRREQNAATSMPRVQYYLMGKNEWRNAPDWPIPGTHPTKYFLGGRGRANGLHGDGTLSTTSPRVDASDSFVYDPATPVPSLGGPLGGTEAGAAAGSFDQRKVELREDVLVYTSEPLARGIEVTGRIDAVLIVSSDVKDTDFAAKLVDVYPDGRAFNIREGILLAGYRKGLTKKVWLTPGTPVVVSIDMGATSNYFGPGHRVRLEVSSSSFPRWDRNLNTGGNNYDESKWQVAHNAVHHTRAHASYLILPVVEQH